MDEINSKNPNSFNAIKIQLASPEKIREWSHGEVTKPETINYRSFKPEMDGLFCERIFGPVKDWECHCGKYKRMRYRGVVCDRCGVEVTQSKVRRERMGHIELAVPVSHIWYFKSIPSRIGYLLDLSIRNLERVIYYESYIVIDPGDAPVRKKELLEEEQLLELKEQEYNFVAEMGATAIRKLLAEIDIEELSLELRAQVRMETSMQRKQEALKRLKVVESFRVSKNRPEWMVLEVIPVIPPDLRPLIPLDGGRFATSDLNDLYRRVINRNNRLRKLMEIKAPDVILRNEKRMLQEAVDALLDNGRRSRAVKGNGNRALKSLSDLLRGKQGRFRQNLLGKRVDYSGRSVIVVGPELKLHQCGLPKNMALELFKPFIIRRLEEKGYAQTVKSAKKLVERERPEVWDVLEEVINDHCVLLNRAPTLHRLGIQAFEPVLVEGKAIKIHPLVCAAFNADFDGDQMAVHVPLSFEAQIEARVLMLSTNNLLRPADGRPIVVEKPQDIVLGCYYLTKLLKGDTRGEGKMFSGEEEVAMAYEYGYVGLHTPINIRYNGDIIKTSVGRIIFNRIVPEDLGFINETVDRKKLQDVTADIYREYGNTKTAEFVDGLKNLGYYYATISGLTVGVDDVVVPVSKRDMIDKANANAEEVWGKYIKGIITDSERYNQIIDVWSHITSDVSEALFEDLKDDQDGFNPIFMMVDSGARGSMDQISQLGGMRGLMMKPRRKIVGAMGEIIETPITSNFKEGLSALEYFISTHGGRKGLADTALKTAEAGYLTRRMVDVAQDTVISEEDCGTILGIDIESLKEGEEIVEPLSERILGRVALNDIEDPVTGDILIEAAQEIDERAATRIADSGIEKVRIRSVLTCESRHGVCIRCYGRNLATGEMVEIGEAAGVIAAQSIGEPGTQLTLRTFHIGGTAGAGAAEQARIEAKRTGRVRYKDIEHVDRGDAGGIVVVGRHGELELLDNQDRVRGRYTIPHGAELLVNDGDDISGGSIICRWDPYNIVIVTDRDGVAHFVDIKEGVTVREELDETTSLRQRVIVEDRSRTLSPHIEILNPEGERLHYYSIPVGARLLVMDGDAVKAGDLLVKIPREARKTRDITGGLPRVAELFEARRPKEPAVVTEIDGTVRFGGFVRGSREVIVTSYGEKNKVVEERKYLIPYGKHLRVHEGDRVRAGDKLSEGPVNPHDILRILGAHRVQEYLVNEIQEVYRLHGVKINDKHIEVIVRQMLQKIKVVDPGDTNFLEGEQVDKFCFAEENRKVLEAGGEPATFQPILLGITKASLTTESFISAASFQETTRILTEAAVQGKVDSLRGLKENVAIGRLIPAGTGAKHYRDVSIEPLDLEESIAEEAEEAKPEETPILTTVKAGGDNNNSQNS